MITDIRGRYPLTLAMLQADGEKNQEVIGVYRSNTDWGEFLCLGCWEKLLLESYAGTEEKIELEIKREYITSQNLQEFEGDLICECGGTIDADTFGIRADLWQCEGCGSDVYAYVLGVETGGKKLCGQCYKKC